jgi:hypothetical protein
VSGLDEEASANIHSSGGLLSWEFLRSARTEVSANDLFAPASFTDLSGRPWTKKELEEHFSTSFADFSERFDEIRLSLKKWEGEEARRRWTLPILDRVLGFDPKFVPGSDRSRGEKGPPRTSHRGWADPTASPVHIVPPSQELDKKVGEGRGTRTPHDVLQQALNASGKASWGIVTNGRSLRVLRTYHHTYTPGFVAFDLEGIFAERSFSDFRALLRLVHASRFRPAPGGKPPLETFYEQSVAAGIKAGEDLRGNVKGAIEALGTGLLVSNPALADELSRDPVRCKRYYEELLRVVYRILFLLFAEQRAMLPTRDSLYAEEYGLTRLRQRAEDPLWSGDENQDLWQGLLTTFQLLKEGCPELKVYPYNGPLFDNELLPDVSALTCTNCALLKAIRSMTLIERGGVLQRISYLDLGVEEIGAIYESLLDYTPRVLSRAEEVDGAQRRAREFVLDPAGGSRKSTGSYYTNRKLVDALIHSALEPVAERALNEAGEGRDERERALLSLKVCDPACGSGAFVIAATEYLGNRLATVRAGHDHADPKELRRARRDVLQNCIYAVDVNPMAMELAKVSLWIYSAVEDLPLNFLDHHIKAGNSLLGMTRALESNPIPHDAFQAISTDEKEVAKRVRKQAQIEESQTTLEEHGESQVRKEAEELADLASRPELTVEGVAAKREAYAKLRGSSNWLRAKLAADAWTAAFFWPLDGSAPPAPTASVLRRLRSEVTAGSVDSRTVEMVKSLADENSFFHWHLEFPDVFYRNWPGFDCVLGNPPWERIKLQEKEFFEGRDPAIAQAETAALRKRLIERLPSTNPSLWKAYVSALRRTEGESKFLRSSGRFPLTSSGDINTYSVFAELSSGITSEAGRTGIIVPTGISTDQTNAVFFGNLTERGRVVSIIDFENREALFDSVHRSYKFSLLTLGAKTTDEETRLAFYLSNPAQMEDDERFFSLSGDDFKLLNPNTRTCPLFRSRKDAELTKGIYRRVPVLINKTTGSNPWGVRFLSMFHMSNDSHLFRTRRDLESKGFRLNGNVFANGAERYLPLYEAKMIWQFDHRYGSFEGKEGAGSSLPVTSLESYRNPGFSVLPRYWVSEAETIAASSKLSVHSGPVRSLSSVAGDDGPPAGWFLGFRDVARATDARTFVATIIPFSAVGNSLPLIVSSSNPSQMVLLLANLQSFVLDYCARQKVGGIHMNFFLVEQFPVLPPTAYPPELARRISAMVLELVYTSNDLGSLAIDLGHAESEGRPKEPFAWDEERRLKLRCELDAIYFRLYGLSRSDVDYVLETFPIVKRKDIEHHGRYQTKELILQEFDKYEGKVAPYDMAKDDRLGKVSTPPTGSKEGGAA